MAPYDRDIILNNSPVEFLEKYPNNIVIIDATELKIQVPGALQKHSETYSTYKSHTTMNASLVLMLKGGLCLSLRFMKVLSVINKLWKDLDFKKF